jgi:hypothetical protein
MLEFLTISSEDITSMLGYSSSLITDLKPILIPIIAISLGLLVVSAIARLFTK